MTHPAQHLVDASKKRQREWVEGRARSGRADRPGKKGALRGGASEDGETQSDSMPPLPHIENEKAPIGRARGGALSRAHGGPTDKRVNYTVDEPDNLMSGSTSLTPMRKVAPPQSADTLDDSPVMQQKAKGGEIARTPSGGVKASARHKAEANHETMKGGSFPIRNAADLANAKHDVARAKDPSAVRKWIDKRARELGEPPLGG